MTTRMSDEQQAVRSGLLNEAASLRKTAKALESSLPSVTERLLANAVALELHASAFVAKDERIKELEDAVSVVMAALTTYDGGRVVVNMRREEYAKVLTASDVLAKVSR